MIDTALEIITLTLIAFGSICVLEMRDILNELRGIRKVLMELKKGE